MQGAIGIDAKCIGNVQMQGAAGGILWYNTRKTKEADGMAGLPKDAYMLLSVINMKLRDFYGSLDRLCDDMDEDKQQIVETLEKIGYWYDAERNAFIR